MKIEIWSDVTCPFCYIGKIHLENALSKFAQKQYVTLEWKSFQLNPKIVSQPGKSITEYLSEIKGISIEEAKNMNEHVKKMAAESGLNYDLDSVVIANSFRAHQIIHLARKKGLSDTAKQLFLNAYFCLGENIDDDTFLYGAGKILTLDDAEVQQIITSNSLADSVNHDIMEAEKLGIRGVPFFVFDRKLAISGAQPEEVFLNTLEKSFSVLQ